MRPRMAAWRFLTSQLELSQCLHVTLYTYQLSYLCGIGVIGMVPGWQAIRRDRVGEFAAIVRTAKVVSLTLGFITLPGVGR
jgi:hypothetical protein